MMRDPMRTTTSTLRRLPWALLAALLWLPTAAWADAATLPATATPSADGDAADAGERGDKDEGGDDAGDEAAAGSKPRRGKRAKRGRGSHRTGAITVFGRRRRAALQPGSAATIDSKELQRHRHDDVGRVLRDVPGATVRDEEGWGLRPNIGMRGANPERSTRIALMEDGVPAAPAPYAAPAAYYFPLMLRIERVEVLKGPAAIRYGPNAIGGALNLVSAGLPDGRVIDAELAGGNTLYGRGLLRIGERFGNFAVLGEAALVRSDGWKRIVDGNGDDTGSDAGFLRRDFGLTVGWRGHVGTTSHLLSLRLGYADEDSHETYLGLTQADFDADPTQRYLATQRDEMRWNHQSVRLRHQLERGGLRLDTTAYVHRLHRVWDKVDGFVGGPGILDILRSPTSGSHAVFLAVLRGQQDSLSAAETIELGRNDRTFVAMGLSSELSWEGEAFGLGHELHLGARLHHDDALRLSTAHGVVVSGGALQDDGLPERPTVRLASDVWAISAWLQDTAIWRDLRVTAGVRLEQVFTSATNELAGTPTREGSSTGIIPGVGAVYQLTPGLVLLGGVFKGYAPVAPGQPEGVLPESAWNLDAGVRWTGRKTRAELIGFAGLYDNLVGTCSNSTGCAAAEVGNQFNGGKTQVLGVEASAGALLSAPAQIRIPVSLALTYAQATFQTSFASSNPAWGNVQAGDAVPYIPTLQLSARTGLRRGPLDLSLEGRYVAPMHDTPSQLPVGEGKDESPGTDAIVQLDAAVSYRFGKLGSAFVQGQNLTGAMPAVSLRPFGARASLPRLLVVGWRL